MKKILIAFLVLACACSEKEEQFSDEDSGVQTVKNVVMYEAKGGFLNWILEAAQATFEENSERISMTAPQMVFKKEEKEVSKISGNRGTMSVKQNLITLSGNVRGRDVAENISLTTSRLNYDMKAKKIWTDEAFTLTRNGVKVEGRGLRANGDLTEIEITNQTTTLPLSADEI